MGINESTNKRQATKSEGTTEKQTYRVHQEGKETNTVVRLVYTMGFIVPCSSSCGCSRVASKPSPLTSQHSQSGREPPSPASQSGKTAVGGLASCTRPRQAKQCRRVNKKNAKNSKQTGYYTYKFLRKTGTGAQRIWKYSAPWFITAKKQPEREQ